MGLRPLYIFYLLSAGIDFRCQNRTSIDVRFGRLTSISTLKRITFFDNLYVYLLAYSTVLDAVDGFPGDDE